MSNNNSNNNPPLQPFPLFESLEYKDLEGLMKPTIHVDEFASKMGDDDDIIVVSFFVRNQNAAKDLMNWFEKGYDWVLDADVSSGEMEDGSYLVFIESLRRPSFPDNLINALHDLEGPTGNDPDGYSFAYHKEHGYESLTADALRAKVPLSPRDYAAEHPEQDDVSEGDAMIEHMQMAAGIAPRSKPVTDPVLKHFVNLSKR